MSWTRRDTVLSIVLVASLVAAAFLRGGLVEERAELVPPGGGVPGEGVGGSSSALAGVLSPASGFFRPVAVNVLRLRSSALRRQGQFFESASLAAAIAELQPRLPSVWSFQAWNLSFNIAGSMPPRERYPWVVEGIRLLRGPGLDYNPASAGIYRDLSWFYFFKVDGFRDDARLLYRFAFAKEFEIDASLPPAERRAAARRLLDDWRIDTRFLDRLAQQYLAGEVPDANASDFDLRVASTHGLYWAAAGLEQPERPTERWDRFLLGRYVVASLDNLLDHGRMIRSPVRDAFACVPDLRFRNAVSRALDDEAERYADDEVILSEIAAARAQLRRRLALFYVIWNRPQEAERLWRESVAAQGGAPEDHISLERFLSLQVIRSEDLESTTRAEAAERLGQLVRGVLGFAIAGQRDLAAGIHRIATAFRADWNRENPSSTLPEVEECIDATARHWDELLSRDAETQPLAERVRTIAPAAFRGTDERTPADFGLREPRDESDPRGLFLFLPGLDSLGPRDAEIGGER